MFIDRDREINNFKQILEQLGKDNQPQRVLSLTGVVGVGKTYLLKKLRQVAQECGAISALANQDQNSPIAVMTRWSDEMEKSGLRLNGFKNQLQRYQNLSVQAVGASKNVSNRQHLTRLQEVLTARFNGDELRLLCSNLGIDYDDDLGGKNKANKVRELLERLERHGRIFELVQVGKKLRLDVSWDDILTYEQKLEDADLPSDVLSDLTAKFATNIAQLGHDTVFVLLLDDFERTSPHLEKWLQSLVTRRESNRVLWVIAIWGGLSGEWDNFQTRSWALHPFMPEEVEDELLDKVVQELTNGFLQFLQEADIPQEKLTSDEITRIKRETLGLPYMLNIASRRLRREKVAETPSEALVRRIREWIADDSCFQRVRKCAIARRLDRDIADALVNDSAGITEFWDWLTQRPLLEHPSIKDLEGRKRFHSIVRTTILRTIWRDSPKEYRNLHDRLANYYLNLIEKESYDSLPQRACLKVEGSLEWLYHLERYYHLLSQSPESYLSLGLELAVLLLSASPDMLDRARDIVQIFDNVAKERDNRLLLDWKNRLEQSIEVLVSISQSSSGELNIDQIGTLQSFFEAVKSRGVQKDVRIEIDNWLVYLAEANDE